MSELKPGGLALVLKAWIKSNVGKCVTTVSLLPAKTDMIAPDGNTIRNWTGEPVWFVTGDGITTEFFSGRIGVGYGLVPAANLLPINPEKVDEKEAEEVA